MCQEVVLGNPHFAGDPKSFILDKKKFRGSNRLPWMPPLPPTAMVKSYHELGVLKHQTYISSLSWRSEIWNEAVCTVDSLWSLRWGSVTDFFLLPTAPGPACLLASRLQDPSLCHLHAASCLPMSPPSLSFLAMLSPQSCPTLCNPTDCTPSGSSVHEIFQARILEWAAISSSRECSWLSDQTPISCMSRWILYHWATWESLSTWSVPNKTLVRGDVQTASGKRLLPSCHLVL